MEQRYAKILATGMYLPERSSPMKNSANAMDSM